MNCHPVVDRDLGIMVRAIVRLLGFNSSIISVLMQAH
jgi:hypothetical protein